MVRKIVVARNNASLHNAAVSRPKEPLRIRLTARVLPETGEAITAHVRKMDKDRNTPGKVLDHKFRKKP